MGDDGVTRAARAIIDDYERQVGTGELEHLPGGDIKLNASAFVRAVLKSIREADAATIDAGNEAMRDAWKLRGLQAPEVAGDAAVDAAWTAMIDALLVGGE